MTGERRIIGNSIGTPGCTLRRGFAIVIALGLLAGCGALRGSGNAQDETVSRAAGSASAPRDIEAPEIFQLTEPGQWDGTPSSGGVWISHPEASEPGRVIIRNETNGAFVMGALYPRKANTSGPRLQVSSEAAAALGMTASVPASLDVVALRRENGPAPDLDTTTRAAPTTQTAPDPGAPASSLDKPFIQVGIFSVEQNARNTATTLREAGMVPTLKTQSRDGKAYWRVLVGPSQNAEERATLLDTIRGTGFSDAYAVDG